MLISGLYAITPDTADSESLFARAAEVLAGGARALQYRSKSRDAALRLHQARALRALAAHHRVPLIVNDDVELALQVEAAGVHVGRDDGDIVAIRNRIGPERVLGVSCYDDWHRAEQAGAVADYVAFGSVFASPTKPDAVRASLDLFDRARARGWNSVAIGGITADNAADVFASGADAVAVISAVFDADEPRAAAERFARIAARFTRDDIR